MDTRTSHMATVRKNFSKFLSTANYIPYGFDKILANIDSFQSTIFGEFVKDSSYFGKFKNLKYYFPQIHAFSGDLLINTILSGFLYFLLEEPISIIENYIYSQIASRKSDK